MASTAIPAAVYRATSSQLNGDHQLSRRCGLQAEEPVPCARFGRTSRSLRLPSRAAAVARNRTVGRDRTGSFSRRGLAVVAATGANVAADADVDLYGLLGVDRSADKAELKRAFRKLALQYHPDVNSDPGAADTFIQLSNAYEVLVDDEQRSLYDRFGAAALDRSFMAAKAAERKGAAWEAFDTWDEFQPFQRKTRKGDARQAAAVRWSSDSESESESEGDGVVEAVTGDVVEYPLSDAVRTRFDDGRLKGVGFVVGRNKDRGDRHKLPPENLGLVEIEPLFQESGEDVWQTDGLESAAFASLADLRVLRTEFDRRTDSWRILDDLSPGCGSPVYDEEIIV
ncbi:hypothetical protein CLOM_g22378 [Closterium sp. NIES-68]|nr:hypothetical protein CLOM_g22378 [Closterium sp. NIES-68]GJP77816.1 hypothetical protein CLOP_g8155 [Closterium sp. NIES-67]